MEIIINGYVIIEEYGNKKIDDCIDELIESHIV